MDIGGRIDELIAMRLSMLLQRQSVQRDETVIVDSLFHGSQRTTGLE
jgi:hypothetical protein